MDLRYQRTDLRFNFWSSGFANSNSIQINNNNENTLILFTQIKCSFSYFELFYNFYKNNV